MADKKPVVKVNSNPNPTPARTSKNVQGRPAKYDYEDNAWRSREGTDDYGRPTYNAKAKIKPLKINTNPVTNHQPRIGGSGGLAGASGMDLGGGGRPEQIK